MSEPAPAPRAPRRVLARPPAQPQARGGPQQIPRPQRYGAGAGAAWSQVAPPARITVAGVREALRWRGAPSGLPSDVPAVALPGPRGRPAAVLCALFDERGQAEVVLTRRSSKLRSHTHQVSFPGGRLEAGEDPLAAALREAREEVGLDPATIELLGELSPLCTLSNPAPITPFVAALPGRPELRPNPAEVERAFTVPLVELARPDVYRQELWELPGGGEHRIEFFELVGDTVWGATARMLSELLGLAVGR